MLGAEDSAMVAYGSRLLVAIGGLAALGAFAICWWVDREGSVELAAPLKGHELRSSPLVDARDAGELAPPSARERATRDTEPRVATVPPPSESPPALEPTMWVEVGDAASGTPLPASRVFVLAGLDLATLVQRLARSELSALEELARRSEQILVTGADGRAAFAPASHARWLFCERGEDFGSAFVPAQSSSPVRVALEPSVVLEIHVRDRQRWPCSKAPVELLVEAPAGSGETRLVDRGIATHGSLRLRAPSLRASEGIAPRLWLRVAPPEGPPIEREVSAFELEAQKVVLVSPVASRSYEMLDHGSHERRGQWHDALRGWLQLESGEPAAKLLLCVRLRRMEGGSQQALWHGLVTTAENGEFRLSLPVAIEEGSVCVLDGVVIESSQKLSRLVSIPWSVGARNGIQELGLHWLVARPLDLLASGVVVDDVGLPVEGATIEIQSAEIDELCGSTGPLREALLPSSSFRSGENGLFDLRGVWLARPFRLRAAKERSFPGPSVEVGTGAQGVTLTLVREAAVRGRVLCDADLDPRLVRGEVLGVNGPIRIFEVAEDGEFLATRLPPEEVALRFHAPRREAVDVGAIATRPGTTTTEKRLQPVDLRGETRFLELELRARGGGALASARGALACAAAPHGQLLEIELDAAGRAKVLLSGSSTSWLVAVEGHLPALVEEREGHAKLELVPARRVALRCEPALELPPIERGTLFLRCSPPRHVPQTSHVAWLRLAERCGVHCALVTEPHAIAIALGHEEEHDTHWVLRSEAGTEQSERGNLLRLAAGPSAAELSVDLVPLRALYGAR
jgi:hypothetical protein